MRHSLEVLLAVLVVSVVVVETVGGVSLPGPAGLLVVRVRGEVVPGPAHARVPVLRQRVDLGQEGLGGAGVFERELPQAAREVGRGRHAVTLAPRHLVGRTRRRVSQEALVPGHRGVRRTHGVRRQGAGLRQGDLRPPGDGGAMPNERGHQICTNQRRAFSTTVGGGRGQFGNTSQGFPAATAFTATHFNTRITS